MRSAALSCASIGESFSTEGDGGDEVQQSSDLKENARMLEFDDCTGDILDGFIKLYTLGASSDIHGGIVGAALLEKFIFMACLRERGPVAEAFLKLGAPICVFGAFATEYVISALILI